MSDDVLGFSHDHEEVAWSHFLAQHEHKPNTEAFVRAFYPPLNVLDKAQNDLYTLRWLETAMGVQLDGIGSIVGITREIPNSVYIPFFGFITQPSGRAFGVARMRWERDPYAMSSYLPDVEYRLLIMAKIKDNNSHGTAEDIIAISGSLGMSVTVADTGNGTYSVTVNDPSIQEEDYRVSFLKHVALRGKNNVVLTGP